MNSTHRSKRSARRGYALMTVSLFLVLMLAMTGVVHRHLSSVLRIEKARVQAEQRDEALLHALAQALALIETGLPPSNPYVCATTINTSQGLESITLTFAQEHNEIWSVHAAATALDENPQPMPAFFVD